MGGAACGGRSLSVECDVETAELETAKLSYDISLVGRRCTVLWGVDRVEDAQPKDFYPATVVKTSSRQRSLSHERTTKHLIHFVL